MLFPHCTHYRRQKKRRKEEEEGPRQAGTGQAAFGGRLGLLPFQAGRHADNDDRGWDLPWLGHERKTGVNLPTPDLISYLPAFPSPPPPSPAAASLSPSGLPPPSLPPSLTIAHRYPTTMHASLMYLLLAATSSISLSDLLSFMILNVRT